MADEWYIDYSDGQRTGPFVRNGDISKDVEPAIYPTGVFRYITDQQHANPPGHLQKHVTPAEYGSLLSAGLKLRFFFQNTTSDADGGYAAGRDNALMAERGLAWIGAPKQAIAFCNDRTTLPNPASWRAYLDGAASVIGRDRVGAYGFRNAIDAAQGWASFFVQCGSRSLLHPNANYWQDNNFQPKVSGRSTDRILVLRDYSVIGGGSTPVGPSTKENEMTRYECRAATGADDDKGYIQVEPYGRTDSFIRVMPGDLWIVDVPEEKNDAGEVVVPEEGHFETQPVFIEHLYNYGVNGEGLGGDPGEQGAVKTVEQKVETITLPNVARCGVAYSSNAPFVIISG